MAKKPFVIISLALGICLFVSCGGNVQETNPSVQSTPFYNTGGNSDTDIETDSEAINIVKSTYQVNYSSKDENTQESDSTKEIVLKDSSVTIEEAGSYLVSGTLSDGQIIINVSKEDTVHLIFNGVDIKCSNSAPIYIKQADKVVITLKENTINNITDGSSYVYDNEEKQEPDAAIFSKENLTINGSGTLNVNANFNDGIASRDNLKILGGTINVTSVNNGIKGKDYVAIRDGNITVNAGGNGIKSTNDEEEGQGFILIEGGTISVTAEQDGIETISGLALCGGEINVKTGGGSENGSSSSGSWGSWGGMFGGGNSSQTETESAKGLKSDADVTIAGGKITVDSSDDSVHSNGTVTVSGGSLNLASGDDGIHADGELTVTGGYINISESYEGLEGISIEIGGGTVYVTASDDGFNAAGGNDGSSMNGRPGQNGFMQEGSSDNSIIINDGYIVINASGDGIDSNGDLTINGGSVIVYGPTNSGNGALDAGGTIKVTGGALLAVGSPGMAEYPSDSSTQYSVVLRASVNAGTIVNISDSDGNSIITFAPLKDIQSIVISLPALENGKTYNVSYGGSCDGSEEDGIYKDGKYTGGTQLTEFTISSIVTNEAGQGGMNAGGRPGGRW